MLFILFFFFKPVSLLAVSFEKVDIYKVNDDSIIDEFKALVSCKRYIMLLKYIYLK